MKIIKKANPNRHGLAILEKDESGIYWITPPYDPDYELDPYDAGNDEASAIAAFDNLVNEYSNAPNWEAQDAYDEAHGTVNGHHDSWRSSALDF